MNFCIQYFLLKNHSTQIEAHDTTFGFGNHVIYLYLIYIRGEKWLN